MFGNWDSILITPEHDEKLNIFCHPKITVDFSHLPNLNMVPTYIAVNSRCKQLIITSPAKLEGLLHYVLRNNFAFFQITVLCILRISNVTGKILTWFLVILKCRYLSNFCPQCSIAVFLCSLRKTNIFHQFRQTKNKTKLYNLCRAKS